MAIYSLSASTIGRSTHAAGTAGAHLAYIGRPGAAEAMIGEGMPIDVAGARAWIDAAEPTMRKNGRVLSKFTLALPAELTDPADRMALVQSFAKTASAGAAPWIAAVHRPSSEGDDRNWHAHVAIHDRDPKTGRTVAGLSDKGTLERLRTVWQDRVNEALERAGVHDRVDARSLRDQGIEAVRPVHLGPTATALRRRGMPSRVAELADAGIALDNARAATAAARAEAEILELDLRAANAREAVEKARIELTILEVEATIEHARRLYLQAVGNTEGEQESLHTTTRRSYRQNYMHRKLEEPWADWEDGVKFCGTAVAALAMNPNFTNLATSTCVLSIVAISLTLQLATKLLERTVEIIKEADRKLAIYEAKIAEEARIIEAAKTAEKAAHKATPKPIEVLVPKPLTVAVATPAWSMNNLSIAEKALSAFVVSTMIKGSMSKEMKPYFDKAMEALGAELVEKIRVETVRIRKGASAGDPREVRNLEIISEGWAFKLKDANGVIDPVKIMMAIEKIEDDRRGGPAGPGSAPPISKPIPKKVQQRPKAKGWER